MALSEYALTDVAAVKRFCNLSETNAKYDLLIEDKINAVSAKIEGHAHRKFVTRTFTEYADGDGESSVQLKNFPNVVVSALYDDSSRLFTSATLIPATDYVVNEDTGRVTLLEDTFYIGVANIKIIYTAGYTQAAMDADVKDLATEWAAQAFEQRTSIGAESHSEGGVSEQRRSDADFIQRAESFSTGV